MSMRITSSCVLGGESVASALLYDDHFPRSFRVAAFRMAAVGPVARLSIGCWFLSPSRA